MKKLFLILAAFTIPFLINAQEALWLRYPAISPDGETILFNFKGDIYSVPSSGGRAIPLTLSDSYEYSAVWSNDGKQVAFASDRYGNFDIYVMPAEGGESTRLTFHSTNEKPSAFTADNSSILFTGLRQDLHTHVQFPSGVMAELYSVPAAGGRVSQVLTTPAHDATLSSDGQKLIFHDRKGYENEWRKHHTSSVTRDVWTYDMGSGEYKQLSKFEGEDRNPVFAANNSDFYYLSEKNGAFNIHSSSIDNPDENQALTSYTQHPVRFLSIADDNTLCYSYDGKIYTHFPAAWQEVDDRYDAREIVDENLKKLEYKRDVRRQLMENGSKLDGPFFIKPPISGKSLKFYYCITNLNPGHNMPSGSLGAQPQVWMNAVLIGPSGNRVWETGHVDSNGDIADIHSYDVLARKIPLDKQLFNLQTKFLTTNVKGTDREMYLPVNVDFDQLPFLRPAAQPVTVINHPPFIRMEGHSLPPLGSRKAKFNVPARLMQEPGTYRLSVRMRSRAEPIYFMRFCNATPEMERMMNEWICDFHVHSVTFEVK